MGIIKAKIRQTITRVLGRDFERIHIPEDVKVMSFDVFDTLVTRPGLVAPSDLFDLVYPDEEGFGEIRKQAEKKARTISSAEDITIDEIYRILNEGGENNKAGDIYDQENEINAELRICKCNPEALKFFDRVRNSTRKIIITSDMYLSSDVIRSILSNCGYNVESIPIYVSSEYGLTKRSGNLFKKIIEFEKVEPHDIIHIGDHLISDYIRPRKCGMRSFLYRKG